jgi:hypothetical protein
MKTGMPAGEVRVDKVAWFNDIEVADDGTIYATQTGDRRQRESGHAASVEDRTERHGVDLPTSRLMRLPHRSPVG